MSTAIATLNPKPQSCCTEGEKLGAEITELCSYIYAAEARLLIASGFRRSGILPRKL